MAEEHVKQLCAAREKLVANRRELALAFAKPHERGHTDSRDRFVAVQTAIEAIDRAIQDEQPIKGPVRSEAPHFQKEDAAGIVMTPRVGHYRANAAECEQKAEEASDPEVKRNFADLARQWTYLVEQAERHGW